VYMSQNKIMCFDRFNFWCLWQI